MRALVFDNWLSEPEKERELALNAPYEKVTHNGVTYTGIAPTEDHTQFAALNALLGIGNATTVCYWRRYIDAEENAPQDPNRWTWIHSDSEMGSVTAVLTLTLPKDCQGGLAFWRHKAYGWATTPTPEEMRLMGLRDESALWDRLKKEGEDPFHWEMTEYVPLAFNRLIVFSAPRFHSRYPKVWPALTGDKARLIKSFFVTPCK